MPTISFKGRHHHHDRIQPRVYRYVADTLSYVAIEACMAEREFFAITPRSIGGGFSVPHTWKPPPIIEVAHWSSMVN